MTDDSPQGTPIDERSLPPWARPYLSPGQQTLDRGMQWMLMVYKQTGMRSRKDVAQRLYFTTIGKEEKESRYGIRALAADLDVSQQTVVDALAEYEELGWIVKQARKGTQTSRILLAWPAQDPLARVDGPEQCAQPTTKGGLCTKRAGKGTTTPGTGPCFQHGGTRANPEHTAEPVAPQPLEHNEAGASPIPEPQMAAAPQPLEQKPVEIPGEIAPPRLFALQPLERKAVDKPGKATPYQPVLLQPLQTSAPTVADLVLQPLRPSAPTVGAKYVKSAIEECDRGVIGVSPRSTSAGKQLNGRAPDGTMISGDGDGRATA